MRNPRDVLKQIFRVAPEHDLEPANSSFVSWQLNTPHAAWESVRPSLGFSSEPSETAKHVMTMQPCGRVIKIPDGDFRNNIHAIVSFREEVKVIPPHPGIPPPTLTQYANSNCVFSDGSKGPYDFVRYAQDYDHCTPWLGFIPFPDPNMEMEMTPELFNPVDFFDFRGYTEITMTGGKWHLPRLDDVLDRRRLTEAEFVRVLQEIGDPTGSLLCQHYGGRLPFLDNLTIEEAREWSTFADGRDALGRSLRYIAELKAMMCWMRHLRNRALDPDSIPEVTSAGVPRYIGVWIGSVKDKADWDFLASSPLPLYGICNVPPRAPLAQTAVPGFWDGDERFRTDAFSAQLLNFPTAHQTTYRGGFCKIWIQSQQPSLSTVADIPSRVKNLSSPTRLLDPSSSVLWSAPFYAYPWLDNSIRRDYSLPRGVLVNKSELGKRQLNISKRGARPMPQAPVAPPANAGQVRALVHPIQALLPPKSDRRQRLLEECAYACYFWAVPITKATRYKIEDHEFTHRLEDQTILYSDYDWPLLSDVLALDSPCHNFSNGATLDRNPTAKRIYLKRGPTERDLEHENFCDAGLYGHPAPPALEMGRRATLSAPNTVVAAVPAPVSHDYSISALVLDIKRRLSLAPGLPNRPRRSSRSRSPPLQTIGVIKQPTPSSSSGPSVFRPLGGPTLQTPLQTTPVVDQASIRARPGLRTLELVTEPAMLERVASLNAFMKERFGSRNVEDKDVTMTDQNEDVIMGERDAEGSQLSRGGIQAIQSTDIRAQNPSLIAPEGLTAPTQASANPSVPKDPISTHIPLPHFTAQSTTSPLPPPVTSTPPAPIPPSTPIPPPALPPQNPTPLSPFHSTMAPVLAHSTSTPPTSPPSPSMPPVPSPPAVGDDASEPHNIVGMFAARQAGYDYVTHRLNRSLAPADVVRKTLVHAHLQQRGSRLSFWPLRFSSVNVQESSFDKVRDIFIHLAESDNWGEIVIVSATPEADETMTVDVGFRFSDDALAMWSKDGLTVLDRHWNISPISQISGKCYVTQAREPLRRKTSVRLQRIEVCKRVQIGLDGLFCDVDPDILGIPPTPLLQIQMAKSGLLSQLERQPHLDAQHDGPVLTEQTLLASGNLITEHIQLHYNSAELTQHSGLFQSFYISPDDYLEDGHNLLDFHLGLFNPPPATTRKALSHGARPKNVIQPGPQNPSAHRDMLASEINWGRRTSRHRAEMNLHAWLVSQPFPPLPIRAENQTLVDEMVELWKWYDECAIDSRSAYTASGLRDLTDLQTTPLNPLLTVETRRNRVRQASYLAMEQSFAPSKRLHRVFGSQYLEVMAAVSQLDA